MGPSNPGTQNPNFFFSEKNASPQTTKRHGGGFEHFFGGLSCFSRRQEIRICRKYKVVPCIIRTTVVLYQGIAFKFVGLSFQYFVAHVLPLHNHWSPSCVNGLNQAIHSCAQNTTNSSNTNTKTNNATTAAIPPPTTATMMLRWPLLLYTWFCRWR